MSFGRWARTSRSRPQEVIKKTPAKDHLLTATRHFILGAAGHVDHGKTTLITALEDSNSNHPFLRFLTTDS
jgi:GTPase